MSKLSEPFFVDENKSPAEKMDEILNHMRAQLDFLCYSAELQNNYLKKLDKNSCDCCEKRNDCNK